MRGFAVRASELELANEENDTQSFCFSKLEVHGRPVPTSLHENDAFDRAPRNFQFSFRLRSTR